MKKVFLLILVSFAFHLTFAQDGTIQLRTNSVPPSPNAAELGKYGEIPINLSTGAPNYNIPVYTISEGDINWSVNLNYNYTGFKPTEGASWVGRGWTLNGGGVITRTVQGIRDETPIIGYFSKGGVIATVLNQKLTSQPASVDLRQSALNGNIDGEPDMFNFNFGDYSGKFFYGDDGQPHIVSNRKIKIEYIYANTTTEDTGHTPTGLITKWVLTTEDGTKYTFDVREYSSSFFISESLYQGPSTWHLSEVIYPSGRKLKFYYTPLGVQDGGTKRIQTAFSEKGVSPYCPPNVSVAECLSSGYVFQAEEGVRYNYSEERFLTKIESTSGYNQILFNSEIISQPVENQTSTSRRLNSIDIKNKNTSNLVISYEMKYDDIDKYALMSFGEVSKLGDRKKPFQFDYETKGVANVIPGSTKALDYWGYYNSAYNNTLIPEKGANRIPNFEKAVIGALNKITYPTGGFTKFEYEQNEYGVTSTGNVSGQQVISELHQFTIRYKQGIGNVAFTVPDEAQYFVEYQCAKDPSNPPQSPNCTGTCPWNNYVVHPSTKLQPNTNYNVNDFITTTLLTNIGCYDDLIIVAKVTVYKPVGTNKRFGPGIRVKKTTSAESSTAANPIVKQYFYTSLSDPSRSSGGLSREPLFSSIATFSVGEPSYTVGYNFYRTESITTLGSPYVIYEDVEERTNNTNKIVYTYSSYTNPIYRDINSTYADTSFDPIGTAENYDFTRGQLLSKKVYKGISNTIVSQTDYTYTFEKNGGAGAALGGYKAPSFYYEFLVKAPNGNVAGHDQDNVNVGFDKFYLTTSGWFKKIKETTVIKDLDGNNPLTTVTDYLYETENPKHFQVVKMLNPKSDGSYTETINKYPLDYETISPKQSFITEMISNNIVSPVIEQQKWINRGGIRTLVNSSLNYYKVLDVNTLQGYDSQNTNSFPNVKIIVPDKQFVFNSKQPIDQTTADTKLFTGNSYDNSIYRQKFRYENYDARSNLRQLVHLDSDNTTYLWGYRGMYLVAEIKNSTTATLESALTAIGSSIAEIYNLETESTIQAKMSSLRAAMPTSLITSYTYLPLIGLSTASDPSDIKTKYVYDSFNRLMEVYDTNDKLVKSYKYEYSKGEGVISEKPETPIFIGKTTICNDNSTTLSVTNCDGDVVWDNEAYIGDIRILNPTTTTTYTAICLSEENVASEIATVTINVNNPLITSITSNSPVIGGGILTFTLNSSNGSTYNWSGPDSFVSTVSNPTIANVENNASGVYTVTVGNLGGCSVSATTTIQVITTQCNCEADADKAEWQTEKISNNALFTNTTSNNIVENSYLEASTTINGTTEINQRITYIDGLGRAKQVINKGGSPTGKDMISPIEYDEFGRTTTNYLSYVGTTNGLYQSNALKGTNGQYATSEQSLFYANPTLKNDGMAFAKSIIEKSPVGRLLQQGSIGSNWQPNEPISDDSKTIKLSYRHNTETDIKKLSYNYTTLEWQLDNFGENELFVHVTKDEKNNKVEEFSDIYGQIVCKKVYNSTNSEVLTTYNAYDGFGRLRFVFPPLASAVLANRTTGAFNPKTDVDVKDLVFYYNYDARGRVYEKKTPDAGVEEMVYNPFNQLVLYRNALHHSLNIWTYTKYDEFGRVISTGLYNDSRSRAALQTEVNATFSAAQFGDAAYPTGDNIIEKTRNYYDAYPAFVTQQTPTAVDEFNFYGSQACNTCSVKLTGKLIASTEKVEVPTGADNNLVLNTNLSTIYYYDEYGRVIQTRSQNHLAKEDVSSILYDFAGRALETKIVTAAFGTGDYKGWTKNTYDKGNRLKMTVQRITDKNGTIGKKEPVGRYKYNELGELTEKWQGCKQQIITYKTNIRGWLQNINGTADPIVLKNQNKFFGMELNYDQDNGEITGANWGTVPHFRTGAVLPAKRGYIYQYDALSRLLSANYTNYANNGEDFSVTGMSYDLNGNIKTMQRKYKTETVDNLNYFYDKGNRLKSVTDGGFETTVPVGKNPYFKDGNTTGDDYLYDNAGNLIEDKNRKITLTYNYLGLPEKITYNNTSDIYYIYSATGEKLQKQNAPLPSGGGVGGGAIANKKIDYLGSFIYLDSELAHIETAEGRALPPLPVNTNMPASSPLTQGFRYEYIQTDYFGNPRTACRCGEKTDANGEIIPTLATEDARTVVQENHFDPWGLNLADIETETIKPMNWWQFNSDTEKGYLPDGSYDYETSYRNYNPHLGRFMQVDLLAENVEGINPFNFSYNNPINYSDRLGLQSNTIIKNGLEFAAQGEKIGNNVFHFQVTNLAEAVIKPSFLDKIANIGPQLIGSANALMPKIKDAKGYAFGYVNAILVDGISLGYAEESKTTNPAELAGRKDGHKFMYMFGTTNFIMGGTNAVIGVAGAPFSDGATLAIAAEGVVQASYGLMVAKGAAQNMVKDDGMRYYHGEKPDYTNPGHHDTQQPGKFRGGGEDKTSIMPRNAEEIYKNAIPDNDGRNWYSKDLDGIIHIFRNGNDGTVHWAGSSNQGKGVMPPNEVMRRFRDPNTYRPAPAAIY